MKRQILALVLGGTALVSCSKSRDFFAIEDRGGAVDSVNLRLCGDDQSLSKRGGRFAAHADVTCEGTATLAVSMMDGRKIDCQIGYVTPGAGQSHSFRIEGGDCVAADGEDS